MGEGSACKPLSRHRLLMKYQKNLKTSLELMPSAQSYSRNENFVNTSKNLFKNANQIFPIVHYFT